MRNVPVRAWVFIGFVVAASVATSAGLVTAQDRFSPGVAIAFGGLFVLSELAPIRLPHGFLSMSFVIAIAAMAAVGPAEAAVAAAFAALSPTLRGTSDWFARLIFNGAQYILSTGLAAVAYVLVGGPVGSLDAATFPGVLVALAVASAVFYLVNELLVAEVIALVSGGRLIEVLWERRSPSRAAQNFAFAVLGVLFATLYLQMGFAGLLFIIVPIVVARRALQAAAQMDDAYEATLSALVTAIEAKDAYTRGHAERVSRLTAMIARQLGMPEPQVRALRHAALMHDVGKLIVSTAVLTKPGKLTDEEYEHMKLHPLLGCEVIEEIDWLRDGEAVNAVRHHHERLDGRGYPDGVSGDDVPLTARIVMVADAFDSMTSTRTYRRANTVENAMTELRRCATTQFDPLMIDALDRAIRRQGWEPSPEAYEGEHTARPQTSVHAKFA